MDFEIKTVLDDRDIDSDNQMTDSMDFLTDESFINIFNGSLRSILNETVYINSFKLSKLDPTLQPTDMPTNVPTIETDTSDRRIPVRSINMTLGDSAIFIAFGWDSFGNNKETHEYTIELDSAPVSLSAATRFTYNNKSISWVLPLFVEASGLGEEGQGYVKDTDDVAPTVFVNVLVIN